MKKNILLILIIIILNINSVNAITTIKTQPSTDIYINMSDNMNSIFSQAILIIPKEALLNTYSINALQFTCFKDSTYHPNQNLVFRFYKYYGSGVFSVIDNNYITPSQCLDYHYSITWNLYDIEIIDHNYDYAFGVYSNSVTSGTWYYETRSNNYNYSYWLYGNNTNITPTQNISILDVDSNTFLYNNSELRNYPDFKILGTFEIPSTPTPTPTTTTTPIPITEPEYGTPLNNSTNLNDLNNTVNNPNAINEISIGGSETVGSIVDKINASALGYTVFGFMIFIIRFFSIKQGD